MSNKDKQEEEDLGQEDPMIAVVNELFTIYNLLDSRDQEGMLHTLQLNAKRYRRYIRQLDKLHEIGVID